MSVDLVYTGWIGELEHLMVETRFIDEMFTSVMGEYVFLKWYESRQYLSWYVELQLRWETDQPCFWTEKEKTLVGSGTDHDHVVEVELS